MVIRTSSIVPEMREAYFRCAVCGAAATAELERGRVPEPAHCSHCNTAHSYNLIHNRSHFSDKQLVKLQESPGKWMLTNIIISILSQCIFTPTFMKRENRDIFKYERYTLLKVVLVL